MVWQKILSKTVMKSLFTKVYLSTVWAGVWILCLAGWVSAEHCYTPPSYDYTISPTESWQTTGTVSISNLGCRGYQMYLAANRGYDFSICSVDGVGGSCSPGDGDFEMYDAAGNRLWYIDGSQGCNWDASTLGTDKERWIPPAAGYYYLKLSDYRNKKCTYNLAYRSSAPLECDIRIEPVELVFDCVGKSAGLTADYAAIESGPENSMVQGENGPAELINEEKMEEGFKDDGEWTKVIVNLKKLPAARARGIPKSPRDWAPLRPEIAARQNEVLVGLGRKEFRLRYRFENLEGFSGEVTRSGLEKLKRHPLVAGIEPVYTLQAHLRQGIGLINAEPWRSSYSYNGSGMAIAVCDTGIDYTHPKLGGGGFPNSKVIGGYDFGNNDSDPMPNGNAHGTCCAGIAAGDIGDVGDYIGGVAYEAKLYALKITSGSGGTASSDAMVSAWDWCVTHQYDDPNHPLLVISTSFGGDRYFNSCDGASVAMTQAANNAVAAGMTVLASGGNNGWCDSICWPACITSVISVGAVYDAAFGTIYPCVDADSCVEKFSSGQCTTGWYAIDNTAADLVTSYSNSAEILDILAPADRTYTTDIAGPAGYAGGDYYDDFSGTSAACPYAAGMVACLQSAALDLRGSFLAPPEVKSLLIGTGDNIFDAKSNLSKPRLNLDQAIDSLACTASGGNFTIYNDGALTLEVTSIAKPAWINLTPQPPFSVAAGAGVSVCLSADCSACSGKQMLERLDIYSNDPDENPYPQPIQITAICCVEPASFDDDCLVNLLDFAVLSGYWQQEGCTSPLWCGGADFNQDGTVNLLDLSIWIDYWLNGT